MIIYEINCLVDDDIACEFKSWLQPQVHSVLRIEGVLAVEILELANDERLVSRPFSTGFSVRYQLAKQSVLDYCIKHLAPTFKQNGINRFGQQIELYLRVLQRQSSQVLQG